MIKLVVATQETERACLPPPQLTEHRPQLPRFQLYSVRLLVDTVTRGGKLVLLVLPPVPLLVPVLVLELLLLLLVLLVGVVGVHDPIQKRVRTSRR